MNSVSRMPARAPRHPPARAMRDRIELVLGDRGVGIGRTLYLAIGALIGFLFGLGIHS